MTLFLIIILCASYCKCQAVYELNVSGEAQHGYYITVQLGTPPQEINLLLDTGSSNFAVAAIPPTEENARYFHTNESTTLDKIGTEVELHYVTGWWKGFLARDYVSFSQGTIKCTIACMVSINEIFEPHVQFQGLLGLAYSSIALPDSSVQPFLDTLFKLQNIPNIFTLDFCGPYFTDQVQMTKCGKFEMGLNRDNYEIIYTPIVKEWFYEVILTNMKIGMKHMPVKCWELNKNRTVIDSGTTDLYLPRVVYEWTINEIYKSVHHIILDKFWINETAACVPFNIDITIFPNITLSFYHTMNSTFNLVVSPELYLLPFKNETTIVTCFKLAFSVLDYGVLIGSSILRGFYVVFDRQNKRIGFGNSKHYNVTNGFPGSVMKPKYTNQNIQLCRKVVKPNQPDLSPLIIVILFATVIVTIILLYMLVSWIFRHFFMHTDESSETSSLVGDD